MAEWLLLVIISAILFAIVNILEKYVVGKELHDSRLGTCIYSVDYIVISSILLLITNTSIKLDLSFAIAIIAGMFMGTARWLYYKSLKTEEISRVTPIYLLSPLFVLILGIVFLNETFSFSKYVGILFLIIGAIIISLKRKGKRFEGWEIMLVVVLSALLFGVRDIVVRYNSDKIEFLPLFFGVSLGVFIVSIILFMTHHPNISKKRKKIRGVEHLFLLSIVGIFANLIYLKAIMQQKAALVSALANSKVFLVLIIAIIFSKYNSKMIREHLENSTIELKIVGTILLFIGAILIVL